MILKLLPPLSDVYYIPILNPPVLAAANNSFIIDDLHILNHSLSNITIHMLMKENNIFTTVWYF